VSTWPSVARKPPDRRAGGSHPAHRRMAPR